MKRRSATRRVYVSALLKHSEEVTVVIDDQVDTLVKRGCQVDTLVKRGCYKGRVKRTIRGGGIIVLAQIERGRHEFLGGATTRTLTVKRRDEGVTWARGWTGEAADALRAAQALR